MTKKDIIDRLRAHQGEKISFVRDAIAEIEQLRADCEKYRSAWLDAISKQAAQEVVGGCDCPECKPDLHGYDNADTDPHHGGKIWNG